jgi:hypothetical protein
MFRREKNFEKRKLISFIGFILILFLSFQFIFHSFFINSNSQNDILIEEGLEREKNSFNDHLNSILNYKFLNGEEDDEEDEEDEGDEEDDEENGSNSLQEKLKSYLLAGILIGSAIAIAAYSWHLYKKKKDAAEKRKARGIESNLFYTKGKSAREIIQEHNSKGIYIKQFSQPNAVKRLSKLGDINLSILDSNFYEKVDKLDIKGNQKEDFIREMLAFSPSERENILNEMLGKFNFKKDRQ